MSEYTVDNSPRNLVDVCDKEDFRTTINGNQYCKLGISKRIGCPRQSEIKDENGLYPCLDIRDDYRDSLDSSTTPH